MKTHLLLGLLTISCITGHTAAPLTTNPVPLNKDTLSPPSQNTDSNAPTTSPDSNTTTTTTTKEVETTTTPETPNANSTPSTTTTTTITTTAPQGPINCDYHISPDVNPVAKDLVLRWAEKAAVQSFNFDYNALSSQLVSLKGCYTDQGWQGFNDALQKSGNLDTIKSQQLMVSSSLNGTSQITEIKENQWKVNVPIQVTYENGKEKITQQLIINLIVGRKLSGDLGIMQMVAIPNNAPGSSLPSTNNSENAEKPNATETKTAP